MLRTILLCLTLLLVANYNYAQFSDIDHDKIQMENPLGNSSLNFSHTSNAITQKMYSNLGSLRVEIKAGVDAFGSTFEQYNGLNNRTIFMDGHTSNAAPTINLYSDLGNLRLEMHGGKDDNGSFINFYNNLNNRTLLIDANATTGQSYLNMYSELGNLRLGLYPGADDVGARIELYNSLGNEMILIDGDASNNEPVIEMFDLNGDVAIKLDVDNNGDSRITTDEVKINGGSDFAEQFDINAKDECVPGMLVSIDPSDEGKLKICHEAYDQKIVGVISGANGVNTGLLMSDEGSIADGEYPIALLGRVYVKVDESKGEINVGDLLTSSPKAGHAMKVKRKNKAQGAIIGKALSAKDENGFVLVLINLQ